MAIEKQELTKADGFANLEIIGRASRHPDIAKVIDEVVSTKGYLALPKGAPLEKSNIRAAKVLEVSDAMDNDDYFICVVKVRRVSERAVDDFDL